MNEHRRLCATKSQREQMARQITKLAASHGATTMQRNSGIIHKRCIALVVAKGEWRCMIDLDGDSRVGAFMGHWYHDGESDATLPKHFDATILGSENPYHRRKATTCQDSFAGFLDSIRRGLEALP